MKRRTKQRVVGVAVGLTLYALAGWGSFYGFRAIVADERTATFMGALWPVAWLDLAVGPTEGR